MKSRSVSNSHRFGRQITVGNSCSQSSGFVNLDAIAKWVAHKESLPRRRATVVSLDASSLQSRSQAVYVRTFKSKMPLDVCSTVLLVYRNMNIQSPSIKPHTASNSKRLWFRNLSQAQISGIKRTGYIFAAFWHAYVDVGKAHMCSDSQLFFNNRGFVDSVHLNGQRKIMQMSLIELPVGQDFLQAIGFVFGF
jgi:hypothetical protein